MIACAMVVGLAIWLAAFIGGVRFLHRAVTRRSGTSWFGAILLLAPLALHAAWCHHTDVDDWNAAVPREALHGRWTHGQSTLEFFADGTFRIDARPDVARRVHIRQGAGRWELEDWNLTLHPQDGYPRHLRVVMSNGAYRIIEAPEDFDTWARWSGFNRSSSAPARE